MFVGCWPVEKKWLSRLSVLFLRVWSLAYSTIRSPPRSRLIAGSVVRPLPLSFARPHPGSTAQLLARQFARLLARPTARFARSIEVDRSIPRSVNQQLHRVHEFGAQLVDCDFTQNSITVGHQFDATSISHSHTIGRTSKKVSDEKIPALLETMKQTN